MTVQELIDALGAVGDKSLPVWAEGCDCDNAATSVRVEEGRLYVEVQVS